jgi:hypothetical protein
MKAEMEFLIAKTTVSGGKLKKCNRCRTPLVICLLHYPLRCVINFAYDYLRNYIHPFGQNKDCSYLSSIAGSWEVIRPWWAKQRSAEFVWARVNKSWTPGGPGRKFFMVALGICEPTEWNLLYVIPQTRRIFRLLLDFWKICRPVFT